MDFVSLKSAAYCALARLGGPDGRNCEGDSITHVVIVANCGAAPGRNPGGVGRHSPTSRPPRNGGGGGVNPSALRQAQISSATSWPHSTPRAMDSLCSSASPSEIAA